MQDKIYIFPVRQADEPGRASRHTLPTSLTSLIGREQEVAAACTLLQRPEVRLLTISGTGGVGKTRLALQVANDLRDDFADGVHFVTLAPISDPKLVIPTIAQTLGLKESRERSLLDLLKAYLQDQHLLLLLDNFEQVLEAAPLLADLLMACPNLKILLTSRVVLRIQGEYEFSLPPLVVPNLKNLPDPEALSQYAAVTLFLDRAHAVKPGFQLTNTNAAVIAEICARLDGIPLAIELAAARIKLLSPQGLLARLSHRLELLTGGARNMPVRQQTLRNTVQWSYDQLDSREQQLFWRLAIFVGGCTLEALEAICAALGDVSANVLDRVESLLDKSLLHRIEQEDDELRLRLLETIREFALECLAASGELEAIQSAHAVYYLSLLEKAWQKTLGAEQRRWFARLEQEHDNLRAALHWSVEHGELTGVESVLRLSLALYRFWLMSGQVSEGRRWLERALAHSEEDVTLGRARGLLYAGALAFMQDDYDQAECLLGQSLLIYQELADSAGVGMALKELGQVALARGNYTLARSLSEEALAHFREAGGKWSQFGIPVTTGSDASEEWIKLLSFLALDNLVRIAIVQGEYARARSLAKECLVLTKDTDDRRTMAISLFHLALLAFVEGEQTIAQSLGEESLRVSREIHYQWGLVFSLGLLGLMALQQGDEAGAHTLFAESLTVRKQVEDQWSIHWGLYCLGWIAFERWDGTTARAMYEKLLNILARLDNTEYLATFLEGLGRVLAAEKPVERPGGKSRAARLSGDAITRWAVRLWGAAEALRNASGVPLLPHQNPRYEYAVTAVRAQLGEEIFAAAWAAGQTMTPIAVIAELQRAGMPQQVPQMKPAGTYPAGLTQREVEILRLLAQGLTDAQIAEKLVISRRTVNWHLTVIYSKIQVTSRSAATRYAIEQKLT